ncbi:hypothetical protein C1646_753890 [Rhizophagus diaphanus]|nr:hypothetical protein C1646_753890 [Rhizophagus diaphanus] [Rhizophagus sp. MUCL 43196]
MRPREIRKHTTTSADNNSNNIQPLDSDYSPWEDEEGVERMKGIEITGFKEIESYLDQAISIVREQHALNNHRRIKAVDKNFDGIRKLVNDITKFNSRITNPRRWKDDTNSTMYLE